MASFHDPEFILNSSVILKNKYIEYLLLPEVKKHTKKIILHKCD